MKSSDNSWKAREKRPINESSHLEKSRNAKASFVSGLDIHGDAIVTSVGYSWTSHDLEHDDVTLKSFFRFLLLPTFAPFNVLFFLCISFGLPLKAEPLHILPCVWLL